MAARRLLLSLAVAALVAGGLGWLYLHGSPHGKAEVAGAGIAPSTAFPLAVVGPAGEVVFNGTVRTGAAGNATALSVLQAAAAQAPFDVEVAQYPGFGSDCAGTYVVSIAGHAAHGSGGWTYRVRPAGGNWTYPNESAACETLPPGEAVRWEWSDSGVPAG